MFITYIKVKEDILMIVDNKHRELDENIKNIKEWLYNRPCCTEYLIRMIDLIGATIVGVKPAELVNLARLHKPCREKCIKEYKDCLLCHSEIRMRCFTNKDGKEQLFIYNYRSLDKYLNKKLALKILRNLGYPRDYSIESYVDYLIDRLCSCEFPHEIGIFLGYPLKDVIGFMGLVPLKLVKVNGWRVYGNEKLSDRQYNSFVEGRKIIKDILNPLYSNMYSA
jgi:hypothetical protein